MGEISAVQISYIYKVYMFFYICLHNLNTTGMPYLIKVISVYIHVTVHRNRFLFNNQQDALIIQIYSVIDLYMFRATSLPIIRSFLQYMQHW